MVHLKELAQTGVMIPEIGLGTWKYAGGIEPLRKGVELGAFLIDTAESYGKEQLIAPAIKLTRHRVFLATKVSPRHFRYADVIASANRSLQLLGTDYIDLYQLHGPSTLVPIEETIAAMESLVDAGKVRFIGVSNFSVSELKRAQAATTRYKIVSNQVCYNLVDRRIEASLLPFCQANHLTVIAYSPLAHGISNIEVRDPKRVLSQVAQMTGKTKTQVALNWCVSERQVVAIPKANSVEHVVENCGASGWHLKHEQIQILEDIKFRRHSWMDVALLNLARLIRQRMGRN